LSSHPPPVDAAASIAHRAPVAGDGARVNAARHWCRVSVLIPLYNSASSIERAVGSALRQSLRDIEVIVADDASGDHGAELVAAMAQDDARLRLLRLPENRGKPYAMNVMAQQASGEWLAVLDADDAFHPTRLEYLLERAGKAGVAMVADNIRYIDAGIDDPTRRCVRTGFAPGGKDRILSLGDLLRAADSFADFDYGILKPVIRRDFVAAHALAYDETTRLAEDFFYLLAFFVAGGRALLCSEPLYDWTMPFGAVSRQWTTTGAGAWRYDYRPTIAANDRAIAAMSARGLDHVVAMLRRRGRQYRAMVPYIEAQRLAASGRPGAAASTVLRHPVAWPLLARRVASRAARSLR
jgi:succinoglycan biosynthesis protein ExoO